MLELVRSALAPLAIFTVTARSFAGQAPPPSPAPSSGSPGVLLIPGFDRTARDLVPLGVRLAGEGIAGLAVSQPGFGRSAGPADYVGPRTVRALEEGLDRLKREAHVDASRVGVYGFSRGGMAAALIAVRRSDLRAAVFGAGIYDFQKAHDEVTIEGIRKNMERETGMTAEAVEARSAILRMADLRCPVLILHGEKDENVPVSQALRLQERLRALGKDFEIRLYPGRTHGIGPEVATETVDFFKRKLAPGAPSSDAEWISLFDGKTLSGWKPYGGKARYEARAGAIVGTVVLEAQNSFLATEREFGDFVLECEFMPDEGVNSGVQFRSQSRPDYREGRVFGYQYEIDATPRALTAGVYDERRRGWLMPADAPAAREAWKAKGSRLKVGDWNQLRIEARGKRIRTWLNGEAMADLEDDMTPRGFIALQVHGTRAPDLVGKQVRWRNLRLREDAPRD